ncbi:MAG: efflux RND transporter permease subunit [Gammaproteobacteria bacterium]|nr:efflux RND transporter permease subunit [Gammaproteobacteria bacterium]
MLKRLLNNHVMANLTFLLVLTMGLNAYINLPRQQDPEVNFNWIDISTYWPGASAEDVEKLVTDPLEDALATIADVRFVASNSREGFSSMLVRFNDISSDVFDKRVNDLRRELQNKMAELPDDVLDPRVTEITTGNAFPTAMLIVTAAAYDENLRQQTYHITRDIERLPGVSSVTRLGLTEPELQLRLQPQQLTALGISPIEVANTVAANFRDVAAGTTRQPGESWLERMLGTSADPQVMAAMPLLRQQGGEIPLGEVAEVARGRSTAKQMVSFNGQAAILLGVTKKGQTNILDLLQQVNSYVADRNRLSAATGVNLVLADDQTLPTRHSIDIMQNNAMIGLLMVVLVTWVFLGTRMSLLVSVGIPFILAATFWVLAAIGQTLNQSVLLGVVIALGMLVDDAVVVAEAVYYRLQRGMESLQAAIDSLQEVFAPITSAVLPTMAAFLPLMLLPGILGKFMMVIPLVVTLSLAVSLIEAYWMLPAHIIATGRSSSPQLPANVVGRQKDWRWRMNHTIRVNYTRLLVKALRWPRLTLLAAALMFVAALGAMAGGMIKMDFFAADPLRLFYISIDMPPASPLATTLQKAEAVEKVVKSCLQEGEARAVVSYSGLMFTETAPYIGDNYGQIMVSLYPQTADMRSVDAVMDAMRSEVLATAGVNNISFVRLAGGPPVEKAIKIKLRGTDYATLARATADMKQLMQEVAGVKDISDDITPGRMELQLRPDHDAIRRLGLRSDEVTRALRLLHDGEAVASLQVAGEKVDVRVMGVEQDHLDVMALLQTTLPLPTGGLVPLAALVKAEQVAGLGSIRHYNFRRAITVEADIDKNITDAVKANRAVTDLWSQRYSALYPTITLDTTGILDDINEALGEMLALFIMGVGMIYLILGTQFRSYFQPLIILSTLPLAFTGVVLGLLISQHPLSLFTLYGVIALAGISVNSAIVLISAANDRLAEGMSLLHATLYASRRRVIPILITSLTTVAGLFSLAIGLGGKSLVWGPVATAIVWGLAFSTLLTLFVIPLIYRMGMGRSERLQVRSSVTLTRKME